ncbi:hypothetical protein Gbth_098_006 [Gluconobacter thailandicus F149-1 = NBRC 100600]|nr:hypothetical protein Gbth_098_006 [Gluconobacter thailandicus F149-1 = NBRC 100600]GEL88725.1 hypothetical protein GTH01_30830 [Gluconobacter thailandicus F149-1 = NBRC 100600]
MRLISGIPSDEQIFHIADISSMVVLASWDRLCLFAYLPADIPLKLGSRSYGPIFAFSVALGTGKT